MANLRELYASIRNTFSRGAQQEQDTFDPTDLSAVADRYEHMQDLVRENKLDDVRAAFDQDADLSTTNLLHSVQSPEMVDILVSKGADVNQTYKESSITQDDPENAWLGRYDLTPLQNAAFGANVETIQRLIDHGADLNAGSVDDRTHPLAMATKRHDGEQEATVRTLLDAGAKVEGINIVATAMSAKASTETVSMLLNAGADPDETLDGRREALSYAADQGRSDVVDLLLDYGANPNGNPVDPELADADGFSSITPLQEAARNGHMDIVDKLVAHGADQAGVNSHMLERATVARMVRENKLDELKAAFDQGADLSTTNLLHHVRSPEMVDFLVGKGANIDEPYVQNGPKTAEERSMSDLVGSDLDGFTPLMFAASTANIPTITRLLEHGADSTNALHCAVSVERQDEEAVARTMIAAGADVDNAIVQFATDHGAQTGTIKALLDGGADPNGMDPDYGRGEAGTALQIAAHKGRVDVADMLLDHGADQTVRNANGDTPLHAAYEHPAMAEMLISRSADPAAAVNATDKMGNTPLTRAASEGKSDTAGKLLENGADPALAMRGDAWREAELLQQSDISRTTERQDAMNLVRTSAVAQEKQTLRQAVAEVEQDQSPEVGEQPSPRRRARL